MRPRILARDVRCVRAGSCTRCRVEATLTMCGIVGAAAMRGGLSLDVVTLMRDTLRHRGPDDEGSWCSPDGRVALGHRRLAVVDLSVAGRQPMTDGSGRIHLVFNGEIYN